MRVKVQAAAISAGTKLTTQQYVATNLEDIFSIFKVYSGVTSGMSGIVYVQLPESMVSKEALEKLDPIFKLATGKPLTKALQDGTTVGELRAFLKNNQKLLDGAADFLKLIGVDITAFTKLVDTLNSLPSVFDSELQPRRRHRRARREDAHLRRKPELEQQRDDLCRQRAQGRYPQCHAHAR